MKKRILSLLLCLCLLLPFMGMSAGEVLAADAGDANPFIIKELSPYISTTIDLSGSGVGLSILNNSKYSVDFHDDTIGFTVLRSPVYGFTPDELADVRLAGGKDFYEALCARAQGDGKCRSFLCGKRFYSFAN